MEHEQGQRIEPAGDHPDEFEIEVSDLTGPRHTVAGAAAPATRAPKRWPALVAPQLRRQAAITGAVLVALLAILFSFYGAQAGSRVHALLFPPPPPPLQLRPQLAGMRCLLDAAWSPESARVALLGEQYDVVCPDSSLAARAGLVLVYDANTAKALATIHADDLIIPSIKAITNPQEADFTVAVALHYQHVLWSSNGKRLAVTFWADTGVIGTPQSLPHGEPANIDGVLLVDTNGAHPRVLTSLASAYGPFETAWDLEAGRLLTTPGLSYDPNGFGMLTPALAYRWQADGTLAPTGTPLNTTTPPPAPPLGPVGLPDGASGFTIWQPGYVTAAALQQPQASQAVQYLPGIYFWQGGR